MGLAVFGLFIALVSCAIVKRRRSRKQVRRLDLTDADNAPDFDPYILPPETRISAYKVPPAESNISRDESGTGVLSALQRFQKLVVGRGGAESATRRRRNITSSESGDGPEDSNVVYHRDGGRFHVPPSYSDIDFPENDNGALHLPQVTSIAAID